MIGRHIQTIFCDDIRHEVSGKVSYIGVYSSELIVPSLPVILPKLCLSVKVVTPADRPLGALTMRVFKNEEVLQEIGIDEEQLNAASELSDGMAEKEKKERVLSAQFMLVFSPIQFEERCVLRVRVQTEDEELQGIALRIVQAPVPA
ncbi:hypothetical protein MNBD_GAMMA20-459 [hydrothermal vent metagenome]|uniref:Uncharacterized protein n=1 Tax=hydrothermal vent metagenome TaxID=652676 RepID=A0A3B1ALQ0_9ZZZZ